ncbi:hypothetical protein PI87_07995 [Ralstonia sp. A12]|uniref:hypothetical protein n=1 Tax=Ralstonia sp. A12 TaxID=1217052 RepID=UPI0005758FF6|nr:hypothetical protein [Ralstonia sp. A12]KHK57170.1 hypothetical protein PI87_07995 [Ralstonia sp. A12]
MIRYFLARGDQGGSATITEGLEYITCSNPPPTVRIATLYMRTYCTACKREGFIAPNGGPRHSGTGPNGKPWALGGDINVCGCNPPPVFYAPKRGMFMRFTSEEIAQMRAPAAPAYAVQRGEVSYDEQAHLAATNLEGVPYYIETADGRVFSGRIPASGLLPRIDTQSEETYTVLWGDEALAKQAGEQA